MNVTIEKACINDMESVEELYNDICDFLSDKEYNPGWRKGIYPTRNEAEYFMNQDALYVARFDDGIVGSVVLTYSANTESNENCRYHKEESKDLLYIHDLVVHPNFHRQGIGIALLNFAQQFAILKGVKALRLYVYEKNSVAINTYEKNGYVFVEKEDIGLGQFGLPWFCLYEKNLETIRIRGNDEEKSK